MPSTCCVCVNLSCCLSSTAAAVPLRHTVPFGGWAAYHAPPSIFLLCPPLFHSAVLHFLRMLYSFHHTRVMLYVPTAVDLVRALCTGRLMPPCLHTPFGPQVRACCRCIQVARLHLIGLCPVFGCHTIRLRVCGDFLLLRGKSWEGHFFAALRPCTF
jgi:hypothetical protein